MFLTVRADNGNIRLALKNGGEEQRLDGGQATENTWMHVAVTMDAENTCLYVDGQLVATTQDITLRPTDFKPLLNYIGRSQFAADPLFKGRIDDFQIYNHALTAEEVGQVMDGTTGIADTKEKQCSGLEMSDLDIHYGEVKAKQVIMEMKKTSVKEEAKPVQEPKKKIPIDFDFLQKS